MYDSLYFRAFGQPKKARGRLAETETKLERLGRALAEDDDVAPLAVLRQMRAIEADADTARQAIETAEREITAARPIADPDIAARWLALIDGIEDLDAVARLQARELVRDSFSRIVLWHRQDGGRTFEIEITARGGGSMRMKFDRETGVMMV